MKLKEYFDGMMKTSMMDALPLAQKLVELEAIEHHLNLMYGIELEIEVKTVERKESKWIGMGIVELLNVKK